ncbi:glycoside hydrolase family 2 TIM barrel-domain containing protein [Paenibacillus pabuli]|uniref:glycoside hydrolase family 2 TIM barrel-domain containing protein n=1 Tax=Paenibacillus pabuli TaxID=1472 RepID=UPI000781EBC0|nr:glycoside hydrolase family 2 TIM barrel-domain containing protein [Paenibacillus pabuli]MEC0125095.1 glycoside hydrolase family 2 TIM barrel-domain containing protein [Paenibacillus pabuli]
MLAKIDLQGSWKLQLDEQKIETGLHYSDIISLPNTTSHAAKGKKNEIALAGALTDEYLFEGYAWFSREIDIPAQLAGKLCYLHLERTRVTTVWIDGVEWGTQTSLNTPHRYEIGTGLTAGTHLITIRVDNTNYPTKGGHLTSEDTQTNWNGITGKMELQFYESVFLKNIQVYPDLAARSFDIKAELVGDWHGTRIVVSSQSMNAAPVHTPDEQIFTADSNNLHFTYKLGEDALLWSDQEPNVYKLHIRLQNNNGEILDSEEIWTGLREFKAEGDKFTINGHKTFLRGKHDGLIFPLTGYAPTDVEEWLRILGISKSYGINHYRFHTCCPPEAAFVAADLLGIYMEPELPFWGTITDESSESHNPAEQEYLISEGYAMLRAFGNHPSFVMMSMGNELWGSKDKLNSILKAYKEYDNRHLYTEGSNNFQFVPDILEESEFFCGVRFSKERLFRGSYAMCDAPLGHVQTDMPNTLKDYDSNIVPEYTHSMDDPGLSEGKEIQIQYGTGAKTVKAEAGGQQLVSHVPVISHEIGQYATFPNFEEIQKYTGSLKAKNFELFRERLQAKGLGHLADQYFKSSGQLAVACYKEELEAAFRSKHLAGFQLLDLQDFSGQGTALVGILDAFMDSKGIITPEEWRTFCSDAVLLARFPKYNYEAGELFEARIELSYFRNKALDGLQLKWELHAVGNIIANGYADIPSFKGENYVVITDLSIRIPDVPRMTKVMLKLSIPDTDIHKSYDLWIYPNQVKVDFAGLHLFSEISEHALELLERGEDVLLFPSPENIQNAIEGFYSTDFWSFPMFRSISESMKKDVPVGTMGLLIQKDHAVFEHFSTEDYSTYPWWSIVSQSSSIILDDLDKDLKPLVQTIDNFERNHKLGMLMECRVLNGRVLMGALHLENLMNTLEGRQLIYSFLRYVKSPAYQPVARLEVEELRQLFNKG